MQTPWKNTWENPYTLQTIMQALYASEINCSVSCFWDGGWDVKLGSEIGGYKAEANFDHLWQCAYWLRDQAIKAYPKSEFAAMFHGLEKVA